jgi:hypothetical protein
MRKLIAIILAASIIHIGLATTETKAGEAEQMQPQIIEEQQKTDENQQKTVEEQQYIVRYGITYNYGSTIITEDGNEWTLTDAPEYENGTEVRVLFDSNKTKIVTDDIIIDVTER